MPDLTNPSTQFLIYASIGFFTLLAAIFIPFIIVQRQRSRKGMAYRVFYNTIVFSSQKSAVIDNESKGIEINYVTYKDASKKEKIDEKRIEENVYLAELKIWNSGDQPISERDYLDEDMKLIEIDFGQDAQVLDIQSLWTNPENMKDKIGVPKIDKNIISFQCPPYLLKGSSINLKVLLTKYEFENLKVNTPPINGELTENYDKTFFGRISNSPLFAFGFFGYVLLINILITIASISIIYGIIVFILDQFNLSYYTFIPTWLAFSVGWSLAIIIFILSTMYITPPISKLIQRKTQNISWQRVWENIDKIK